jgi:hypothetical protein
MTARKYPTRSNPPAYAARTRWLEAGLQIPADTDDVRQAIKRECWTRDRTLKDLAASLGLNLDYLERVLSHRGNAAGRFQKLTPGLLERIIDALKITPRVARRLRLLGAIDAGWRLEVPRAH